MLDLPLNLVSRIYLFTPSALKRRVPLPLARRAHSVYDALRLASDKDFKSNKYASLSFLEEGMKDRPCSIDKNHENIVKRLSDSYRRARDVQGDVPLAYKPATWKEYINTRAEYVEALNCDDTSRLSNLLRNFFRNNGSLGLLGNYYSDIARADVMEKKEFILTILKSYEIWKDFVGGDLKDVSPPLIGNPWGYYIEGNLIMRQSFRHHRFATLVNHLLADIDNPVVAEIGGGYSGIAYYLLKQRDDITYINFELPEVILIGGYYLMNAFPDKKFLLFGEQRLERISSETTNSYDIILLPNFELPKLGSDSVDLFIVTSLSERDVIIREYASQIARTCRRYFFLENCEEKVKIWEDAEFVPSQFSMPEDSFKRIYRYPSLLSPGRVFREYLYERINKA